MLRPAVHTTMDEGRYLRDVCCLDCHAEVRATIGMASPVRMYVVAFTCDECREELVTFDQFTGRAA